MLRIFFLSFILLVLLIFAWAGPRGATFRQPPIEVFPDMDRQAKVMYQTDSGFFSDGIAARRPIEGTLPIGYQLPSTPAADGGRPDGPSFTHGPDYINTGRFGDYWGDGIPAEFEVDAAFIERGRERYNIHCKVCHGASGDGRGVTQSFGILNAANMIDQAFSDPASPTYRPDGSIYDTIANGRNLMGPYGSSINVHDRWAIVAYLRALQWAVNGGAGDTGDTPEAEAGNDQAPAEASADTAAL